MLENCDIKEELNNIKSDKEELFRHRLDLAKANKSPPWQMEDLEAVLKFLKNNKSRDPVGNINELFKPNIVGVDLNTEFFSL